MMEMPEDYIGNKKVSDIDWRKYADKEDDMDDDSDSPASPELVDAIGFNPDKIDKEED